MTSGSYNKMFLCVYDYAETSDFDPEFIFLENVPGHTNSAGEFTLSRNIITIINDEDCDEDGIYEFFVSEIKLAFIVVTDECIPRIYTLLGVWSKKLE